MKIINLTQKQYTIVDDDDYENLIKFKWYARKDCNTYYALRFKYNNKKHTEILMHRLILNAPNNFKVDHIDGNGLNNQKYNLRLCTSQQNNFNMGISKHNKSGFKGVSFCKSRNKWYAYIMINGRTKNLGRFLSINEAALKYNNAAKKYFGEFARLNKLD
jgi:hypothetical protein